MGISVNAISLFAMLLVSGVIVDDALIVLENIYRHMEKGLPRKDAVVRGLQEVFWPVTSSALTTMGAFLPMLLMVGVIGEFFSIIPQVIVVTLLASLFECFVILPVHFFDFGLRRKGKPMADRRGWGLRVASRIGPALRAHYDRMLGVVLRHRYAALAVLLSVAFLTQAVWKRLDTVLFPSDFQVFIVDTEMPADASLEQTSDASRAIDAVLERVRSEGPFAGKIDNWTTSSGAQFTEDNILVVAPNISQAFVSLKQGTGVDPVSIRDYTMRLLEQIRDRPANAEEERLAADLRRFSKIVALAQQDGPPTGKPVAVRVRCDDLNVAEEVAGHIKAALREMPGVHEIADNHNEGRTEFSLALRDEVAAAQGVSFARAAGLLAMANEGKVVSIFKDPGGRDDADVRLKLDPNDRASVAELARVKLRTRSGATVPLGSLARIDAERSDAGIYRFDGWRTILVTASTDDAVTTAVEVNQALEQRFDEAFVAGYPDVSLRFPSTSPCWPSS
jgi:HAE1 family hydrophobic/amphiphilic exporter-1